MVVVGGGARVLVVGGTGHLGGQVARQAAARGYRVRALVRPGSDAATLAAAGVEVVAGDLLDRVSLDRAVAGCAAVVTTAIGYANRRNGDRTSGADTFGNRNLVDAAACADVGRFVLCSILTCDQAPDVPHFWAKKLVEDHLAASGLPYLALRPGAFLDQGPGDFWAGGLRRGRLRFLADPRVPATFVHSADVATFLVDAIDAPMPHGSGPVDIGCDRPVSVVNLAAVMSAHLGRPVRPQVPPRPARRLALGLAGLTDAGKRDLAAMMRYFETGVYFADTTAQRTLFGEPPRVEDAVARYLTDIGMLDPSPRRTEEEV